MFRSTFTTSVVMFVLTVIVTVPVFADNDNAMPFPVPGEIDTQPEQHLTMHLASPLYPEMTKNLGYQVQIFDKTRYDFALPEGKEWRMTVFPERVREPILPVSEGTRDNSLQVKLFVAGNALIQNDKFIVGNPGTVLVTAIAYSPTNAKLIWVDSAQFSFTTDDSLPMLAIPNYAQFADYDLVYWRLADAIVSWSKPEYTNLKTKKAMEQAFGGPDGRVKDAFLPYLSALVSNSSHGRYEVYRPSEEDYDRFGGNGLRIRYPFVDYLARKDMRSGEVRSFALLDDGSVDFSLRP